MMTQSIPVSHIDVGASRRVLSRPAVKELAASISEIGLLSPIAVARVGDAYELIAGRHRLAAAKQLGWQEIPAVLVELDDVNRRLAEIDENLIRNDLSDLERAEHLATRKRLYLLKHPETKRGGDRGNQHTGGRQTEIISFSQDAAEKIGVTDRSIRQDVQIAESIPEDVRDALRETPVADSKTDLLDIARLPEEAQREVIATADLTSKASVRQAVAAHRPTKPRKPEQDISQDIPDDLATAGADVDPAHEFPFNNEPTVAPKAEQWCQTCGGKYRGAACPCATVEGQPTAATTVRADGVRADAERIRDDWRPVRSAISDPTPARRTGADGAAVIYVDATAGAITRALFSHGGGVAAIVDAIAEEAPQEQYAALVGLMSERLPIEQARALYRRLDTRIRVHNDRQTALHLTGKAS